MHLKRDTSASRLFRPDCNFPPPKEGESSAWLYSLLKRLLPLLLLGAAFWWFSSRTGQLSPAIPAIQTPTLPPNLWLPTPTRRRPASSRSIFTPTPTASILLTPTPLPTFTPTPLPALPNRLRCLQWRYSYYYPPLGGVNCANFTDGVCDSPVAFGDPWENWLGKGIAVSPAQYKRWAGRWVFVYNPNPVRGWWRIVDVCPACSSVPASSPHYVDFLMDRQQLDWGELVEACIFDHSADIPPEFIP